MKITMKTIYPLVSNEEKNEINLRNHIKSLFLKIHVPENVSIITQIVEIFGCIKKKCGNKRGKLRDSIILVIISRSIYMNVIDTCKKIGILPKYIYQANDILLDININVIDTPFDYIRRLYTDDLESDILPKTKELIDTCIINDTFPSISNKSIGTVCLYKILLDYDYKIDLFEFSNKFNVSVNLIRNNVKLFL